jgi:hypothetical protein
VAERLEVDTWGYVGKKQKRVKRHKTFAKGDQYVFVAMAGTRENSVCKCG